MTPSSNRMLTPAISIEVPSSRTVVCRVQPFSSMRMCESAILLQRNDRQFCGQGFVVGGASSFLNLPSHILHIAMIRRRRPDQVGVLHLTPSVPRPEYAGAATRSLLPIAKLHVSSRMSRSGWLISWNIKIISVDLPLALVAPCDQWNRPCDHRDL